MQQQEHEVSELGDLVSEDAALSLNCVNLGDSLNLYCPQLLHRKNERINLILEIPSSSKILLFK